MPTNIDELSIKIEANADKATQAIHNLTASLSGLSIALNRINTSSISRFAKSIESLSTVGRRTDETSRAVQKMADTISSNFGIKSREGVDNMRSSMEELLDSTRKFFQNTNDMSLGDNLEQAQRNAVNVIKDYARIENQLNSTTRSVYEYVKATNSSGTKVSVSDMAKEFGENFAAMRRVLGSGFTAQLKSTQQGVQDFAEYLSEMNSILGTSFDTERIDVGFSQLVEAVEDGKQSILSYNEAVKEGIIANDDAKYALFDYSKAISTLVESEEKLIANNGLDAIVKSLREMSDIKLPDFTAFAETIKGLNNISTEKVVRNIKAVKAAMDETAQSSEKMLPAVRDVDILVDRMFDKFKASSASTKMVADGFEAIRGKCELAVIKTDEFTEKLRESVEAIKNLPSNNALADMAEQSPKFDALGESLKNLASEFGALEENASDADKWVAKTGKISLKTSAALAALAVTVDKVSKAFNKIGDLGIKAFKGLLKPFEMLRKFSGFLVEDFKDHTTKFANMFKSMKKSLTQNLSKMSRFWKRTMKTFTFMLVRKAITAIITNVKEAVDELAQFEKYANKLSNGRFNDSLTQIIGNFKWMGRSIVAAFEPLINFVVPALNKVAAAVAAVAAKVSELMAALTGQSYFVKSKKTVTDYADSISDANKAAKEHQKLLLGIDEINNLNKKNSDSGSSADAGSFAEAYETSPVSQKMEEFANKIKKIFSDLFEPMKKAWDKAGAYVISGFKEMVSEVGKLEQSMWRDFITVWKQDETVKIFENLLKIIGDLERVVGNLAKRFREAWGAFTDDGITRGQSILEKIRDLFGIIIEHVRNVTSYMKEWANQIDFNPLLSSLDKMLEKLKPVANFLGGVFEDIMKNIVLEHIRYLTEEGLPHLFETIGRVSDAFNWEDLRKKLEPVEQAFERLRQHIHEGLVNAMGNLGEKLGKWTQTEEFKKFCDNVVYVMDQVTPERVEKFFTMLGNGILFVVEGLAEFVGSDDFKQFIDNVVEWYDKLDEDAISNLLEGIGRGIAKIAEDIGKFVNSALFEAFMDKLIDWMNNSSPEDIATALEHIAIAIAGFKFAAFVGTGFAGFLKLFAMLKGASALGSLATSLGSVGTAASTAGTALGEVGAAEAAAGTSAAAAGTAASAGAASVAGVAATAAAATADLVLVGTDIANVAEAIDTYSTANETYKNEIGNALNKTAYMYRTYGADITSEWAKTVYGVETDAKDLMTIQNEVEKSINESWEGIPKSLAEGFEQGWDYYFGENGQGFVKLAEDAFSTFISKTKEILGIHSPSTVFEDIGGDLVAGLEQGLNNNWQQLITDAGTLVTNFVKSIVQGFTNIKNDVSKNFEDTKKNVVSKVQEMSKNATTKFEEFKKNASTKFKGVKDAIDEKMKLSIETVTDKLGKIKEKFQKFDLTKMAENIVRGFTNGLKTAWVNVTKWANESVAALKNKFAEALKIGSPSKVFEAYGKWTVEGFNKGISTFSDTTSKTVDKWVGSFSNMEVSLEPTMLSSSNVPMVYQSSMIADSTITKDDLVQVLNSFADRIITQRSGETKIVLEMDGRKMYEQIVRQDRNNKMRTGRSAFAY